MRTRIFIAATPFLVATSIASSFAGSNYTLKIDRFQGKKVANYEFSLGSECKLNQTSKSDLVGCSFLAVSTETSLPSLMFNTTSNGWDIMTYRSASPYSEKKAPVIITYKNGTTKNMLLPAIFSGDVIRGGTVMETVIVRLGSIKQDILSIGSIEVKYGSNEYYVKLDEKLTKKAINYQE
jgi:hypothetical protein